MGRRRVRIAGKRKDIGGKDWWDEEGHQRMVREGTDGKGGGLKGNSATRIL